MHTAVLAFNNDRQMYSLYSKLTITLTHPTRYADKRMASPLISSTLLANVGLAQAYPNYDTMPYIKFVPTPQVQSLILHTTFSTSSYIKSNSIQNRKFQVIIIIVNIKLHMMCIVCKGIQLANNPRSWDIISNFETRLILFTLEVKEI